MISSIDDTDRAQGQHRELLPLGQRRQGAAEVRIAEGQRVPHHSPRLVVIADVVVELGHRQQDLDELVVLAQRLTADRQRLLEE